MSWVQDDAENALEAVTEPEGELEEPTPNLDTETPTVCIPLCSLYRARPCCCIAKRLTCMHCLLAIPGQGHEPLSAATLATTTSSSQLPACAPRCLEEQMSGALLVVVRWAVLMRPT